MERHEMDIKFNMSRDELSQQTLLDSRRSSRGYDRHRFLALSSSGSNYCNDIIKRLIANANTARVSSTSIRQDGGSAARLHQQRAARHRRLS